MVQTESEKRLRKMIRKDEKRQNRQRAKDYKRGNVRDDGHESLLDIDLLREQREAAMIEKSLEKSKTYALQEQVQVFILNGCVNCFEGFSSNETNFCHSVSVRF